MTTLNKSNFFQKVQQILEKYYLIPLDGAEKKNLKDGFIERPIHGATHASRAALWALTMHNYLQNISPDFVNESMAKIARHLNIETEELLLLILITMVCHDAARKGEGQDLWEAESAQITHEVLLELGLEENHAKLFSMANKFKDSPQEYSKLLNLSGIGSQDLNAFGYIRSIINLGDNLDLPRCVGDFKAKFIFKTLKNIKGFNEDLHAKDVMELLKEIHHIIYEQGDMLFSCNVLDLKSEIQTQHEAHISFKEKVSYEHAENVLAALFEDLAKNPKIQPLLAGLNVPKVQKYTSEAAYDPFIHGTNSSILSILPKSNFEILSPLEMMGTYHAAPMTGELTQGGYRSIQPKGIGKTSFAKISAQGKNSYTLSKVLSNYTNLEVGLTNKNLEYFKQACDAGFKQSYLNINLILIYFVRARQSHDSLEQVISQDDLSLLFEKIEGSIQFYYFMQLLGTHIFPNVAELNKFRIFENSKYPKVTDEGKRMHLAAANFLTYENIVQKIMDNKINIKEIIDNPTKENLTKILNILEVPKTCTLKDTYGNVVEKDIKLPLTQFFSMEPYAFKNAYDASDENVFSQMQAKMDGSNGIHQLLTNFISGYATNEFFLSLGEDAKQHLEALQKRMQLFKDLINTPQSQFKITAIQEYFLERKFPLVLLSEAEESINLFSFGTEEYRSNSNLKFGTDIKIIATDTNFHRLEILKYLELHNINTIQVILFSDLEKIKANHKKPVSPQHNEGVPTLKWMAAQKAQEHFGESVKNNSSLFSDKSKKNPKLYSEKNISEVSNLLGDAKTYQDIQFEPCCVYRCSTPTHHSAIEILVKAGVQKSDFKSLIGYSAKDNLIVAKLIGYLSDLNLPQLYIKVLNDAVLRQVLALFFIENIKEGITEDLLNNTVVINYIDSHRHSFGKDSIQAIIALYHYDPNLLSPDTMWTILTTSSLVTLINYFEKNNLKKYFGTLINNSGIAYQLFNELDKGHMSNQMVPSILDDKNIIRAVTKYYIYLSDKRELDAAFILSGLGIEINSKISYELTKAIHQLNQHGFTDKATYLKVMSSTAIINTLSNHDFKTVFQINTVLKGDEFNTLNAELGRINQYPQLSKMLAFANNKDEWNSCSQFFDLLANLKTQQSLFKNTNKNAYDVAGALIDDINYEIDNYFSFANNNPNKIHSFSVQCNKLIEVARAVLEVNTGILGVVDSALFSLSYFYPTKNQQPKNPTYSFFKNDTSELLGGMKETLGKMEKDGSDGTNNFPK